MRRTGIRPPKYQITVRAVTMARFVAIALTQYLTVDIRPRGIRFCKKNR